MAGNVDGGWFLLFELSYLYSTYYYLDAKINILIASPNNFLKNY